MLGVKDDGVVWVLPPAERGGVSGQPGCCATGAAALGGGRLAASCPSPTGGTWSGTPTSAPTSRGPKQPARLRDASTHLQMAPMVKPAGREVGRSFRE